MAKSSEGVFMCDCGIKKDITKKIICRNEPASCKINFAYTNWLFIFDWPTYTLISK